MRSFNIFLKQVLGMSVLHEKQKLFVRFLERMEAENVSSSNKTSVTRKIDLVTGVLLL